jgi:glycosyltransferase involved in cell wall biosynthesis
VNPSGVNFARLVARARATVDVRPPGPVGTIAIESMLLGVPVVVPDDSASRAHVAAANGGLWYRDVGELFDAVRVLVHSPIGAKLAQQGRSYALAKHGDIDDFVARTATLVLGGDRARTPAQV